MDRALLVAIGFLAGVIVGGFAAGYLIPTTTETGGPDGAPAYSYTTTTSEHVEDVLTGDRGWVHEVHVEEGVAVTGNATVVHDGDQSLRLTITRTGPGTYELAFHTVPREADGKMPEGEVASTIDWGTVLPMDYEEYVITVEGTTVKRVSNDEATTARLLRVPHPLSS